MVAFHNTVGTLVILGYLATVVFYGLAYAGRPVGWTRQLSFGAAGLLMLQYLIGFSLLGAGHDNRVVHYVLALSALVTVGLEHGLAGSREVPRERAAVGGLAALGTLVLVVATYAVGQTG